MCNFRRLQVWVKAHALVLAIFDLCRCFPKEEKFGITSQLKRAVVSIPTNIAEGSGRDSDSEFAHFLNISLGSASEVEYLLQLCRDLDYIPQDRYAQIQKQTIELKKMLLALKKTIKSLKASS